MENNQIPSQPPLYIHRALLIESKAYTGSNWEFLSPGSSAPAPLLAVEGVEGIQTPLARADDQI